MNKKSVLGLILFACIVIAGMFLGTMIMIRQPVKQNYNQNRQESNSEEANEDNIIDEEYVEDIDNKQNQSTGLSAEDGWFYTDVPKDNIQGDINTELEDLQSDALKDEKQHNADKSDDDTILSEATASSEDVTESNSDGQIEGYETPLENEDTQAETEEVLGENIVELPNMQLITDSSQVDYMKYIPEMIFDSKIEVALDINNPSLDIKAKSAILFDVKTRKVLYYKDPIEPVFPASTAKLLTALVALDWCMEEEEVTVGDELDLVAYNSTIAGLKKGQVLTIRNLIEGMLIPSGNDAAYVTAAYVGRKSLKNDNASLKEAIPEFIRLMNEKAKILGAINSCFKTPDGYDAIGQYTTSYDMGLIGLAAADNEIILEVCNKSRARNVFVDGFDVTWSNTNSLIKNESGRYYPYCIGLKTGTSTMAGRCLVSLAKKGDREVISVVMHSNSEGRWEDSRKLLDYGLSN